MAYQLMPTAEMRGANTMRKFGGNVLFQHRSQDAKSARFADIGEFRKSVGSIHCVLVQTKLRRASGAIAHGSLGLQPIEKAEADQLGLLQLRYSRKDAFCACPNRQPAGNYGRRTVCFVKSRRGKVVVRGNRAFPRARHCIARGTAMRA